MNRFNFVFLLSAVGLAAALECPAVDKAESALTTEGTTDDGFISCDYPTARFCTYFTNGDFSSGSSDCPSGLDDGGAAPPPPPPPPSTFQCPTSDKAGSALTVAGMTDDGFVSCTYPTARFCTYFTNGDFSSGSSDCPPELDDSASQAPAPSATATCLPADDAGGALITSGVTPDGFVSCSYASAGFCTYFTDGSFSSGSSDCPDGILAPLVRRSVLANCPATDDAGTAVVASSADGSGFFSCSYPAAGLCAYFNDGSFSSGSSTCPNSADPLEDVPTTPATEGSCPPNDYAGGALLAEGTVDTFISCTYEIARFCTYFTNGNFDSGSSDCPPSIPPIQSRVRRTLSAKFGRGFRVSTV